MSGASVGARCHGGNVGGFQDEEAGGGSAASAGRDIDDHWNGGVDNFLDNLAGRLDQAAGGVDFDQQGLGVSGFGFGKSPANVFVGYRLNGVVQDDLEDICGGETGQEEERKNYCETGQGSTPGKSPSWSLAESARG